MVTKLVSSAEMRLSLSPLPPSLRRTASLCTCTSSRRNSLSLFPFSFSSFCLFFCVVLSGHCRLLTASIQNDHFYFIVRKALAECHPPSDCVSEVQKALLDRAQVPRCNASDYFVLLDCLDSVILTRTNLTELNSRAGKVCCEVEQVNLACRLACRSALFSPTLSHHQKQKRIEMVCHFGHGNEIRGDRGVLNCLQSTRQWLHQKHELKN